MSTTVDRWFSDAALSKGSQQPAVGESLDAFKASRIAIGNGGGGGGLAIKQGSTNNRMYM